MTHAVIFSGGKQYRVKAGDVLMLESLEVSPGDQIQFDKVLATGDGETIKIGHPYLADARVSGKVLSHGRHKKIHIVKFRRRKHHMKSQGHRQNYTKVEITAIEG